MPPAAVAHPPPCRNCSSARATARHEDASVSSGVEAVRGLTPSWLLGIGVALPVGVAIAVLVAVMALAFAGCGGDDEDGTTVARASPDTTAEATPTEPTLPPEPSPELVQALRRDANTWASLFAVRACNRYLGQPLCERIRPAFQKSFADATVEDIEHKGTVEVGPPAGTIYRAAVTFSNGVVVVFGGGGQRRCPQRLRAQDQVDHRVNDALGSSCRIAASSKPPPSSARYPAPASAIPRHDGPRPRTTTARRRPREQRATDAGEAPRLLLPSESGGLDLRSRCSSFASVCAVPAGALAVGRGA